MPEWGRPQSPRRCRLAVAPAPVTAARKRWPLEVRAASVARFEAGVKARVIADELGTYATLVRMWAYLARKRAAVADPARAENRARCLYCCARLANGSAVCSHRSAGKAGGAWCRRWRGEIYIPSGNSHGDLAGDQRHDHPRPPWPAATARAGATSRDSPVAPKARTCQPPSARRCRAGKLRF